MEKVYLFITVILHAGFCWTPSSSFGSSVAATLSRFPARLLDMYGGDTHSVLKQPLPRSRRQTTCTRNELDQLLAVVQCDSDFLSALSNLEGAECSYVLPYRLVTNTFTFERDFPECGVDKNGMLCGVHDSSDVTPSMIADDVIDDCIDSRNCTDNCKTTLQNFSGRFGCCIHSLEVTQSSRLIRALTPQLWEDCGVSLPAPCDNAPPGIAPFNRNASCSYACTLTQFQALFCKYQAAETIQILQDCGEDQRALLVSQFCGFNDKGEFCATVGDVNVFSFFNSPINELDDEYVLEVYNKCIAFSANGNCPMECREALVEAREKFGCCFNNINRTALGTFLFSGEDDGLRNFLSSDELWMACVVETPGFCELSNNPQAYDNLTQCSVCEVPSSQDDDSEFPLDDSEFPLGVIGAVALVAIILMIAVPILIYCCYRKRHSEKKAPVLTHTANSQPMPENHNTIPHQEDGVNTIHYYDYIPPLPVTPVPLDSNEPPSQATPTKDVDDNMTTNASYNRVLRSNDQTRDMTPNMHYNIPTSTLSRPPLPPPNRSGGGGTSETTGDEGVGYIEMVPNPASSTLRPAVGATHSTSEEVVMYI